LRSITKQFMRVIAAIGRLPSDSMMKSSSQRSFFIVTPERPFALDFTSHSSATALKLLARGDGGGDLFQLDLSAGSSPRARYLAGGVALFAGLGKAGIGPYPERQRLLFAKVAIVHAPVAAAIGVT
jgi:hypothetical protein